MIPEILLLWLCRFYKLSCISNYSLYLSSLEAVFFQDGAFLVRNSQRGGDCNPYTLTLLYSGHVYNLHTRKRKDGKFALGTEKTDEHVRFVEISYFILKRYLVSHFKDLLK